MVEVLPDNPTAEHCVNSLVALKALGAGVVPCLTVLGYYAPADGGGGSFYWDDSASEPDNGGTVIAPASNPPAGRWKRLWSALLSVRWFGAKGDGSNDDTAAIDRTITAAAVFGGCVYFPTGTYSRSTQMTVPYNVSLRGESFLNTIIYFTGATNGIVVSGTAQNVAGSISELCIESSGCGLTGIFINNVQDARIDRCRILVWTYQGVVFQDTILCEMRETLVSLCGALTGTGLNGGTGYAAVEVDSANVNGNHGGPGSTTWYSFNNNITNNPSAIAGLRIDRTGPAFVLGGTSEGSGIAIQISSKSESYSGAGEITIVGMDLEYANSSEANWFIDIGYGLCPGTGPNRSRNIFILNNTMIVDSGSIPYGIKCKNTDGFNAVGNYIGPENTNGNVTANIWFEGTTNTAMSFSPNAVSNTDPYVQINGVTVANANPQTAWSTAQLPQTVGIASGTVSLTMTQASTNYLILTGTLTGNVTLVAPSTIGWSFVIDATAVTLGGHTITLQANSNNWGTAIGTTNLYLVTYGGAGKIYGVALTP